MMNYRTALDGEPDTALRTAPPEAEYRADLATAQRRGGCFFAAMGDAARARRLSFNEADPPRPDVYEVMPPHAHIDTGTRFYAAWSGQWWGRCTRSIEDAQRVAHTRARLQRKAWREVERP